MMRLRGLGVALLMAGAMAACGDSNPVEPLPQSATKLDAGVLRFSVEDAPLLPMVKWTQPRREAATVTRHVDPLLGGTLSAGGVTLVIPPLAVSRRTAVTLTVPAGEYVQVDLQPHGLTFRVEPLLLFPVVGTESGLLDVLDNLVGVYSAEAPANGLIRADELYPLRLLGGSLGFRIQHFSTYAPAKRGGYVLTGG